MKESKAKGWLVLWGVFITLGTICMAVYNILRSIKNEFILPLHFYGRTQLLFVLVFTVACLVPMLVMSCRYAIIERNKKIRIATICILIHHAICVIAVLLQLL